MEGIRFHSPYHHWVIGLLAEVATFVAFMLFVGVVAYLVSLIG
ncbi:MAG: hypothetical protein Q7J82_02870 [Coriobacteriia bacterium]|nr:hypothetical protein [Coriobacteriia bacterium]